MGNWEFGRLCMCSSLEDSVMMIQKFENGSICDNRLLVKSRRSVLVVWEVQVWQMKRAAPFPPPWLSDNVLRVSALTSPWINQNLTWMAS
jgi:hypothetical protein